MGNVLRRSSIGLRSEGERKVPLPVDIIELIVQEVRNLDRNDFPNLRSCALTCRDFLGPAQSHIFRFVIFDFTKDFDLQAGHLIRYVTFREVLMSAPKLGLYIREFRILWRCDDPDIELQLGLLPDMLNLMLNLTTFGLRFECGVYSWGRFPPGLEQALLRILLSTSLENISIEGLHDVPATCAEWIACIPIVLLSSVRFGDAVIDNDAQSSVTMSQQKGCYKLKALSVHDQGPVEDLQPLLDVLSSGCQLEQLTVCSYRPHDIAVAQEIMKRSKIFLTKLKCTPWTSKSDSPAELNIGMFPRLKTITIWVDFSCSDPFEHARQILSKARKHNEVKDVVLELVTHGIISSFIFSSTSCWNTLDTLLTGPLFAALDNVSLSWGGYWFDMPGCHEIGIARSTIETYLPILTQRGLLRDDLYCRACNG